ncbi:MAG: hypothetical protein QW614_01385 [Candidatus Caldarchaeum sp.]|uniref:Uncharacterized protein n=1 Tax=Caldiarchaeum subterraneum TaxID=311458 RepID=A0A7C5QDU3_CALS0
MVSVAGAEARILFRKQGYTPHYAEYVEDPVTGEEVVVMADPHSRRSAFIYNPSKRKIIWEFKVPGTGIKANPHIARMAVEKIAGFNARPGDVLCADRDNRFIVVDRVRKVVRWSYRPSDAVWSHDFMPTKDFQDMLTTDYGNGYLRRINHEGKAVWSLNLGKGLAKLSRIYGNVASGVHGNSYGGEVLAAVNQRVRGVYEISEDRAAIVWSCPPPKGSKNCFFTLKPHAALRLGLAELGGNVTVFNHEAGGGFVAVDRDCRPRWGVMKPLSTTGDREIYRPSSLGLYETTHVFHTPHGFLGIIDWDGAGYSTVYELEEPPAKTSLYWLLAWQRKSSSVPEFLDPPVETGEWRETAFQAVNHGPNRLRVDFYTTLCPVADTSDASVWRKAGSLTVEPSGVNETMLSGYSSVRVAVSSEGESVYTIYVVNRV